MRTVSAPYRTRLGGRSVAYFSRIEVRNETGTWVNLQHLGDGSSGYYDWVLDCTWSADIDTPIAQGVLTLMREQVGGPTLLSLAPFMTASTINVDDLSAYSPLIHPGRGIRISIAVMAGGTTTAPAHPGSDWIVVFEGRLDDPEWGPGSTIVVPFRDLGALLADVMIEETRQYGTTAGAPLEDVITQIFEDNGIFGLSPALPDGSPLWMLRPYEQSRVNVFEACRTLALQIGWDLRYRWNGNTPQLQLYDPGRTKTFTNLATGFAITPAEYTRVTKMTIGDANVRNVGKLKYTDAITGLRAEVTAIDTASINTFNGRRYIELSEASTSNIDTAAEAQAMIDAVIADLSTPFADHGIASFFLWPLELNDLLQFAANDVHYDAAQTYAIVGMSHRLRKGHITSELLTRGKPAGGYMTWINRHGPHDDVPTGFPAPVFSYLLGEESHGGGETGDGMVWIGVQFERNTQYIEVWAEQGDDANVPTPDIANNSSAVRLFRQEGVDSSAADWTTIIGIATTPLKWRRIRACGFGYQGQKGPDWVPPAVQAIDPVPTPIDGTIDDFSVTTTQLDDNVLAVTPGTIDPGGGNWIIIRRDGVDIMMIFIDTDASQKFITDSAINPNAQYTYDVFIWNNGVSGLHYGHLAGLPDPPGIVWDQGTPKLIFDTGLQQYFVQLSWVVTGFPTADHIFVEYGKNGIDFPSQLASTSYLSTLKLDPNIKAKWYRLRLEDASNAILGYSPPISWPGAAVPPSWGGLPALTPPTWNPEPTMVILRSPSLSIGVPSIQVGFICGTAGAVTCAIQSSLDDGATDPWTDVYESAQLAGDHWNGGPGVGATYFRLQARDATGAAIVNSTSKHWNGSVTI